MTIAIPRLDRSTAADRGLTIADFLVPIRLGERLNARARDVVLVVAGALFIYLTARISIPVPGSPVPITGQTFGVLLVGGALGLRRGLVGGRAVRPARRRRAAVLRRGQGRPRGHLGRHRRLSRSGSSWPARSSAGWPSSAGIGSSAARSGRCSSAARRSTRSACRGSRSSPGWTVEKTIAKGLTPFLVGDTIEDRPRGRAVPGRLVDRRAAPGRPLGRARQAHRGQLASSGSGAELDIR